MAIKWYVRSGILLLRAVSPPLCYHRRTTQVILHPEAARFAFRLAEYLAQNQDRLVIDADAHATDLERMPPVLRERYLSNAEYYHGRPVSAEDLLAEMEMASVDMALIWQNPSSTGYTSEAAENAARLLEANRYVWDAARRFEFRFIPAGWTDPKACGLDGALRIAETCVREFGFSIVKMNPAQNRYPIDSPEVVAVVDRIVELGAVPAFHFGADTPFTPAEGLRAVARRHPDRPVLAVHMGGGGAAYEQAEPLYQQARRLGLDQPNIHYAISAKRDTHIESDFVAYQAIGEPFSRHLFCGSDAPYGRMTWHFGGYRALLQSLASARPTLFSGEAVQGYLGGNLARFAAANIRHVLEVNAG